MTNPYEPMQTWTDLKEALPTQVVFKRVVEETGLTYNRVKKAAQRNQDMKAQEARAIRQVLSDMEHALAMSVAGLSNLEDRAINDELDELDDA